MTRSNLCFRISLAAENEWEGSNGGYEETSKQDVLMCLKKGDELCTVEMRVGDFFPYCILILCC